MNENKKLEVIVPICIDLDWVTVQDVIRSIREQHDQYGLHRFMLCCPGGGHRKLGFPSEDTFRHFADFFCKVKETLAPEGIEFGWWITATVRSGADPRWNPVVTINGTENREASCPLNPVFRETFSNMTALFVKLAKPAFVITEDDFTVPATGCFCEHHLAEFSKRENRIWTREELKNILEQTTPEAFELRRRWQTLMRDSLVSLAAAMREAVDRESPEVPMGTMESGCWLHFGNATEEISRAMAGKAHAPFSRLHGTFYGGENIPLIPQKLTHALYMKQHLGKDFRCYHESDTFPHTRFFTSGACMRVLMESAYSFGFAGSTFQTAQLLDDCNEEKTYCELFKQEQHRFQAIRTATEHCTIKGVRLVFDSFWCAAERGNYANWDDVLGRFAIPYTTLDSKVTFLSGNQPAHLSDAELKKILSGAVFLDGTAADVLCKRGYSRYLGIETEPNPENGTFDLGGREIIEPAFIPDNKGRHMHKQDFFAPNGNGQQYFLKTIDPACEVITRMVTFTRKEIAVGMTRFINEWGGKVIVISQGVTGNTSSSLYNYRRQKLIHEQLLWCCDEFVFLKEQARVFLIMNEADSPANAGFDGMLTISNLNPDPVKGFELHLPPKWKEYGQWFRLAQDGTRQPVDFERTTDGIRLALTLDYAAPEIIFAKK